MSNFNIQFARLEQWTRIKSHAEKFQEPPSPSIKYTLKPNFLWENKYQKTHIMVEPIDSVDCGLTLKSNGYNPVVLNLADNSFPGGCVGFGSGAQEESIFRRSNYFKSLDIKFYPLELSECIYSPEITIFTKSENAGWSPLDNPYKLDFIACPGIKFPVLESGQLSKSDREIFANKVDLILQTAYTHAHDSVVLGALGCGAWKCPPDQVAQIFSQVISKYSGAFKLIDFAILKPSKSMYLLNDIHQTNSNFEIFSQVFN